MYTYILLIFFSFIFPFLFSFEKKMLHFKQFWTPLFIAIFASYLFMMPWDHLFTVINVWSFNSAYTLGIQIWELPIEEHLFFIVIPYCCVFIYEILNKYSKDYLKNISIYISIFLVLLFSAVVYFNYDKLYTATASLLSLYLLLNHLFVFRSHHRYLSRFYLAYIVIIIPFSIVNGILTSLPVVIYHPANNTNIRLYTIPIEDLIYNFFMLLLVVTIYEYVKK
ncbi:MAG: lycopene cyclase domain-containing protein, partial [Bacteroidetes bacterium]|nr:lycopene cyclase domain-containing protein [Bacteroidota bacterium]